MDKSLELGFHLANKLDEAESKIESLETQLKEVKENLKDNRELVRLGSNSEEGLSAYQCGVVFKSLHELLQTLKD